MQHVGRAEKGEGEPFNACELVSWHLCAWVTCTWLLQMPEREQRVFVKGALYRRRAVSNHGFSGPSFQSAGTDEGDFPVLESVSRTLRQPKAEQPAT